MISISDAPADMRFETWLNSFLVRLWSLLLSSMTPLTITLTSQLSSKASGRGGLRCSHCSSLSTMFLSRTAISSQVAVLSVRFSSPAVSFSYLSLFHLANVDPVLWPARILTIASWASLAISSIIFSFYQGWFIFSPPGRGVFSAWGEVWHRLVDVLFELFYFDDFIAFLFPEVFGFLFLFFG